MKFSRQRYFFAFMLCFICVLTSCGTQEPTKLSTAAPLIPVRFAAIVGASQSYIPDVLISEGIGKKYGFDVQMVNLSSSNQQWNALRSKDADVASGSFLDLLRQRKKGLNVQAFRGFLTFSNQIIMPIDKSYQSLPDLKGARVGTSSTTSLDWMILRAAEKKAHGFDIGTDTQVSQSSPQLLTQMILRHQLDAALQFSNLSFQPLAEHKVKQLTSVQDVLAQSGFDANSFYLLYNVTDSWRAKYGNDAVVKLSAAMNEEVDTLQKNDSVWTQFADSAGIKDSRLLPQFRDSERATLKVDYNQSKLASTQALLDQINKVVGKETTGVTTVDPKAFDFTSIEAAKSVHPS